MKKIGSLPENGAVYGVYAEGLGKYGAYQILEAEKGSICYVVLDYLETELPEEEILSTLKPLKQERYRYHGAIDIKYISNDRVPRDYRFIGICPPVTEKKCNTFSGDWADGREYEYEENWKISNEHQRAEYKKYINSGDRVKIGIETYSKNYGRLNMKLYEAAGGKLNPELFPCMSYAELEGPVHDIINSLSGAELIIKLRWDSPETEVLDLRNTHFSDLDIDGTGVKKIYLPSKARSLTLRGTLDSELEIIREDSKPGISLAIVTQQEINSNFSLINVSSLRIGEISELDLKEILPLFPGLRQLSLNGKPGYIKGLEALREMKQLRSILIGSLFGYTAEDLKVLEELPELRKLYMECIPKEAGAAAKKTWKGKLDSLDVRMLRGDDWLKDNLDNPFRHWDGNGFVPDGAFKKAKDQYKKTKKAFLKAESKEMAVLAVKEYGEVFNRLNRRYNEFIETEEREDIFSILGELYKECLSSKDLISEDEVMNILDGIRDDW